MQTSRPSRFLKAFTLLELLVAISIVAVLAALAVPIGTSIVNRSKAASCMSNLKSLGSSLQLYLGDHENVMPTLVIARSSKDEDQPTIDNTLDDYAGNQDVFCCKADTKHLCETTGTSYLWNHLINGQNVSSMNFMGLINDSSRIPVIGDKEDFHLNRDVKVNILYVDGHVAKELQFAVGAK